MVAEEESRRRVRPTRRLLLIPALLAVFALIAGVSAAWPALARVSPAASADAPARAADTATVPAASADAGISLAVAADNGGIATPGMPLSVSVTITNTGADPYAAGDIALWLDPTPIADRPTLTSWLSGTTVSAGSTQLGTLPTSTIEPNSSVLYRLSVPAESIGIANASGATYGIGATLSIGDSAPVVGRGALIWDPAPAASTTAVTVMLPMTTPPSVTGIISAADLATYTAPNGILTRQLDALALHPEVTIGIDPMIITSIRVLGNAAPPTSRQWLRRLAELTNDIFPLQYGDADPTGQVQQGQKALIVPTSFDFALDPANFKTPVPPIGESTANADLPTPTPTPTPGASGVVLPTSKQLLYWPYTISDVAWPGANTVTAADVSTLAAAGLPTTIIASSNTSAADEKVTPNASLTIGSQHALITDSGISSAIQAAASASSDAEWNGAMTRANADLQLLSESPASTPRTIMVDLGRQWPSSGSQLDRTIRGVDASPWSTPSTFGQAVTSTPTAGVTLKDAPENAERLATFSQLLAMQTSLNAFASVLDNPQTLIGQTRVNLLSTFAVGWLGPKYDWDTAAAQSLKTSQQTLESVSILKTDNVNLVGTQGSIPFTVSNVLPNDAVTIVLSASPSNPRLEIDSDASKRVQADSRATVLVPVKAELGNGRATLTLQLYSKTGVLIGGATTVPVEVHADWEGIGALIVGILLVLLFGFGIVRNILRRRSGVSAEGDESGDDAGNGEDGTGANSSGGVDEPVGSDPSVAASDPGPPSG